MDFMWVVILMVLVFSLPDLLRRKRRYPMKKRPPEQKESGPMTQPAPAKSPVNRAKKRLSILTGQAPAEPPTAKPVPPQAQPAPAQVPQTDSVAARVGKAAALQAAVASVDTEMAPAFDTVTEVPMSVVQRRPQLNPAAQQIYAGIIWSELLQPPLSIRHRDRKG